MLGATWQQALSKKGRDTIMEKQKGLGLMPSVIGHLNCEYVEMVIIKQNGACEPAMKQYVMKQLLQTFLTLLQIPN